MDHTIKDATLSLKANVYFDGGVISHTVTTKDGKKKTIGIIRPGTYHFTTDASERMDIISGECRIKLSHESAFHPIKSGDGFNVPAKSAFDIAVDKGMAEYLCSFGG